MKRLCLALLCSLTTLPAAAESLLFEYSTDLTPRDTYNSSGKPLNDFCAVVQQDRANVHKFGNPDNDPFDGYFHTPERRALIAGKCDYDHSHHTVERIRSNYNGFVVIRVFGENDVMTRMQILEAAG